MYLVLMALAWNAPADAAAVNDVELSVLWQQAIRHDPAGTPSVPAVGEDGTVYLGSPDANLYAFSPNGVEKWRFKTGRDIGGDVAVDDRGVIYVASDGLYAVGSDGKVKWHIPSPRREASAAAVGTDGTLYFQRDARFCAVARDGDLLWERTTNGMATFSPVIGSEGTVYASGYQQGSLLSRIHAFASAGQSVWTYPTITCFTSGRVIIFAPWMKRET
ncbi:MAG: PQQ-binding-like beta-propeller repeat protein [Chthoniobacterales bacterium]